MRSLVVLGVLALALQSCAPAGEEPVAGRSEAIAHGTREPGMPAVTFLYNTSGAACTSAIVAPRAVLTAKHCIQGGASSAAPASSFRVLVGASTRSLSAQYFVSEVRPAPGRWDLRDGSDVAMVILSSPASEEPLPLTFENPSSLTGQTVTAVGYGQTESGSSGTKYRTDTQVGRVDSLQRIFVDPSVCSGDSGGPVIGPDGFIWGVASFIFSPDGGRPQCGTAPGAYNGIARYRDFIETAIEDSGSCVSGGDEVCNGEDDDCDEAVDETCTPLGEACTVDDECVGQTCADTPAGRICSQECDPLQPGVGCPAGMYCASTGECGGHCTPGTMDEMPKGLDEECTEDTECATLFCTDPGDGTERCLQPCKGDEGLCLAGEVCAAGAGACGGCVSAGLVRGARGLGEPCDTDDACREEMCFEERDLRYCTRPCEGDGECPDAFHCRASEDPVTGESVRVCIKGPRESVGGGCVTNGDCGEGLVCAFPAEGESWCASVGCSEGGCADGFECTDVGDTSVCEPVGGLVGEPCGEGMPDCAVGVCAGTREGHVCTRFCGPDRQCSPGFECVRIDDEGRAVCLRPEPEDDGGGRGGGGRDGGCAVGEMRTGGAAGIAALMLLVVGLLLRRRRY